MQTKKITALLFPKLKKMIRTRKMDIFFIGMMMSHQKKKVNSISVIVLSRIYKNCKNNLAIYIDVLSQCLVNVLDRLAAKLARKDSLALKLSQRPQRQELIERNILQMVRTISFYIKNDLFKTHHIPVHHSIILSFRIGIR